MIELTLKNFDETIKKSDNLVIVDFWAEWCGPCRVLTPMLEDISKNFTDNVIFAKCNVDDYPTMAAMYSIRNIPTVLFFKNGELIDRQVGLTHKENFINKINILSQ